MTQRINRAIELLESGQPIYYTGGHTGHVLTYEQGRADAGTWADYINVGMEHGAFDMTGLAAYMQGLVDGGGFEDCLVDVVNRGGDADTTGAIAGMLAGALYGQQAIPKRWLQALDAGVADRCRAQARALLPLAA